MEDPILTVTDGLNLQNITLRLSKEEAETCLSRLMGFTGPARPTWPLITALGQVVFADRLGPLPRSLGVIKFDVDTESLGRKLEELRSERSEPDVTQPKIFVHGTLCDDPNHDFYGWTYEAWKIHGGRHFGWRRTTKDGSCYFVSEDLNQTYFYDEETGSLVKSSQLAEELLNWAESRWENPMPAKSTEQKIGGTQPEHDKDPFRHYVKAQEAKAETVDTSSEPQSQPAEEESSKTSAPETPDTSKTEASGPGKIVRLSAAKALLAVNHITKSAALACEEAAMTPEDYALLKLWLKRSFGCTTNALGRNSGVSVEQLKERIRAQSVAGTLIIEDNGLSPTVLTKGKAAPTVKPIDLSSAGQDDEPKVETSIPQVLLPGRALEVCRSRKATGVLESRLLEAFIQSGQKVQTFIAGLDRLHGMVVVP